MNARILVVDDEPDLETLIVQKFRRRIREGSVSFLFAHDGIDALEKIRSNGDIDMVLSDINMPRMDGLSLLEKLRTANVELTTVIVSAYGDMANIRTAMNRGAFDFLTKPIDFADLEATIEKTLRHLGVLREARSRMASAERAHASLSRYFSPSLAQRLTGDGLDLAGQRREVASLFTDIAGFTRLVETLDPGLLGELLNGYLAGMTEVVFALEGTVAKIIGDALHILFGAPADQPDHVTRAVACALDLDVFSQAFRATWRRRGVELGPTRIGVHAGPAIVGNFGGARFFDYTAYGDTINTAARLEDANKALGTRLCVSDVVARRSDGFKGRPIGDLMLRGRAEPLGAFEPLLHEEFDTMRIQSYLGAYSLLTAGDPAALAAFAAAVGNWPDDPLSSFHLRRLLNGASGTRIAID